MAQQPLNVRTVFARAQELDAPGDRQAYLDEVCAGNPELRREVESLLRTLDPTSDFRARPSGAEPPAAPDGPSDSTQNIDPVPSPAATDEGKTAALSSRNLDFLQPSRKPGTLGKFLHYEVLEVLGQGGFGIVLKAFDEKLQRLVAIKVLGPQVASNATERQRFVREARAAAGIRDPHVIKVFEVEEAPRLYLVMEYVRGQTLQDRINRADPLDVKEIVRIGAQVASGLAAAHRQGQIHRDIKPANILLETPEESGSSLNVKITDFGLAKAVDDASLTQSGAVAGTPFYMSPEQASGEPLDSRSDLFSLGTVLYTLCTGVQPFRAGKALGAMKRVCEDTPPPVREVNPNMPDFLSAIVRKLLAKDPGKRFQTAAEVADLLQGHLAHLENPSVQLPPPFAIGADTVTYRRPRWEALGIRAWRRRWILAAGIAALVTGIGLLLYLGLAGRGRQRLKETPVADAPGSPLDEAGELAALTANLEKEPNNASGYHARATWYARRGRWQECAQDLLARIELVPKDPVPWLPPAVAMLLAGDVEGYRNLCRRMAERYRGTQDARDAGLVLKVCLLLPGSSPDGLPREVLQKALDRGEIQDWKLPWAEAARGLAAYRAGDYPEAVLWSSKVEAQAHEGKCGALAFLIRAMAESQLHRPNEAHRSFAVAVPLIPGELRTLGCRDFTGKLPVGSNVIHHDWLVAEILRREAEELLFPNLPAYLKGERQPRDNNERLTLAAGCWAQGHRLAAAQLYADAFAADPKLAEDRKAGYRYTAACCAVRARAATGAASLDDQEKAHWRRQALHWLQADLAAAGRQGESGTAEDRADVRQAMRQWQRDPALAGVRSPDALARLPADEREEWLRLWAEVEALGAKTQDKPR